MAENPGVPLISKGPLMSMATDVIVFFIGHTQTHLAESLIYQSFMGYYKCQ